MVAFGLKEKRDLLKKAALCLRAASFLDACFSGVTLVPFMPATYRSQSEVLKTLDWHIENGKALCATDTNQLTLHLQLITDPNILPINHIFRLTARYSACSKETYCEVANPVMDKRASRSVQT